MNQMITIIDGHAAATLRNNQTNSALLLDWSYDSYVFNYKNTGWIKVDLCLGDIMADTDKRTEFKQLIFMANDKFKNDPSKKIVVNKLNDYLLLII